MFGVAGQMSLLPYLSLWWDNSEAGTLCVSRVTCEIELHLPQWKLVANMPLVGWLLIFASPPHCGSWIHCPNKLLIFESLSQGLLLHEHK
jgi:hypothetical protein